MSSHVTSITRAYSWEAGHRIADHPGKCKFFHGHRYEVRVTLTSSLGKLNMVTDFAGIDDAIGKWIADNLDHTMIVDKADRHPATDALRQIHQELGRPTFETDGPPTAEILSRILLDVACQAYTDTLIAVSEVTVYENARSSATSRRAEDRECI